MADFGTILTAMVTPFNGDGAVNPQAAATLMRYLVENGSDGIVVAGTTGEAPTLDDMEKLGLFELALAEVGGKATVIAGTGSNDTAHSVKLTAKAAKLGVHGHLVVTPYYNKPPRQGIVEHFKAVAAATDKPVMVYNIPSRCAINLDPDLQAELGKIDNVVAVKQANADMEQAKRILDETDLALYAGDDNMLRPFMEIGASGGVSFSSHIVGKQMNEMACAARAGELAKAEGIEGSIRAVYETLSITSGTIMTKAALNLMGYDVGSVRLPLVDATDDERAKARAMLENLDLIAAVA